MGSIQKNYQDFTTLTIVFLSLFLFYSSREQIWYHLFTGAYSFPQRGTKLINSMAKHNYAAVGNLTKENCTCGSSNLNRNGWPTVKLSWFLTKATGFLFCHNCRQHWDFKHWVQYLDPQYVFLCVVIHRTENHCMLSNGFSQDSNNFPWDNDRKYAGFMLLFSLYYFNFTSSNTDK